MSVQRRSKADLLEEMRELEERLEHLSAATAEGVFVHENGRILYLNQSGASMYGFGARGAPEPRRPEPGPAGLPAGDPRANRGGMGEALRNGRVEERRNPIPRRAPRPKRRRRPEDHSRGHGPRPDREKGSGAGAAREPGALPLDSRESARRLLPRTRRRLPPSVSRGKRFRDPGPRPGRSSFRAPSAGKTWCTPTIAAAPRRSARSSVPGRAISTGPTGFSDRTARCSGSATCPGRPR